LPLGKTLSTKSKAGVPAFLFDLLEAAKLQTDMLQSLIPAHSRRYVFFELMVDVKAQLVVELVSDGASAKQRAKAKCHISPHHAPSIGAQHQRHSRGQLFPSIFVSLKLPVPALRQLVVLSSAIVVRCSPSRLNQSAAFESVERRV
jgi:hypothetical protein